MLDEAGKRAFAVDGYVLLRGIVDATRVRAARDLIADAVAADTSVGRMREYLSSTFCPGSVAAPALLALLDPLRGAIASLFGTTDPPIGDTPQIALRFPQLDAMPHEKHGCHIDGFPEGANGIPKGTIFRNTLLAGIYLTPVRGPDRGNVVVWPGSHLLIARAMRELDAPAFLGAHGAEALLATIRTLDVGAPVQLDVEPGDAVLAHHLLAHGAADNYSLHTREAVYFRLLHPEDQIHDPTPLMDAQRFFAV